ncbi:MAG: hypothetical protein EP330_16085 [Deltaproteobacteria bacterium]|nr:MAG: hypothetical protein EP330_16085 [Deltaproteobacteria bacterium]
MSEEAPETIAQEGGGSPFRMMGAGCGLLIALAVALPIGGYWWYSSSQAARQAALEERQLREANETFAPAMEALEKGAQDPGYDIDATVRVIHELDRALESKDSLDAYMKHVAMQDYRDVAPEVLEARRELMDPLLKLYAKQVEASDKDAMWEMTSELLLSTLSVVEVEGDISLTSPTGGFAVDREQAARVLQDIKEERAAEKKLIRDMAKLETELVTKMFTYGDTYYKYLDEWDKLSMKRDRAYLAVHNGDWDAAIASADEAIALAPKEREAHLLKAYAMIQRGHPEDDAVIGKLLDDYKAEHPDSTAPALLLEGTLLAKRGNYKQAELVLQQSAAYFPRQAESLGDMTDPYRARSYLRKSREGSFILELYQSTMLGAGGFSPDLQMAAMLFEQGDNAAARQKVMDHFARRRTQKEWGFVLSDLAFCHDLLGPRFWDIFPEDTYLDLEVSAPLMGSGVNIAINNRSPKTLHNATLVLVVQFTDMYPDDYESFAAPETVPAIVAHETTSFGTVEMKATVFGEEKDRDDVVRHRAILIADEAVTWVETEEYKIAEAEEFREKRRVAAKKGEEVVPERIERHPEFQKTVDEVKKEAFQSASLAVESKYGNDNVLIELPRELSMLRPIFKLKYGDEIYSASDNMIEGDKIQLRFAGVDNFDEEGHDPNDLELLMASPFGDVVLTWLGDGKLTWRFAGAPEEEAGSGPE